MIDMLVHLQKRCKGNDFPRIVQKFFESYSKKQPHGVCGLMMYVPGSVDYYPCKGRFYARKICVRSGKLLYESYCFRVGNGCLCCIG